MICVPPVFLVTPYDFFYALFMLCMVHQGAISGNKAIKTENRIFFKHLNTKNTVR